MTTNTKAITRTVTTTKAYPKFAFCSAITPADPEYYARLKAAGIDTASICLHLSGYSHYKFATIHTNLARQAGMSDIDVARNTGIKRTTFIRYRKNLTSRDRTLS
jgi:hypothetical protein